MARRRRLFPADQFAPNPLRVSDAEHARKIKEQAAISRRNMIEFDGMPDVVRRVEHAVGNIGIACRLVAQDAEPIVRKLLERRWGTG